MLETYYRDTARSVVYTHIRDEKPVHADFHLHDQFEIYFFLSGDVNYFIEKKMYTLQYGDLLIMNGHEIHKPSFFTDAPYERIVLQFDAAIAEALNSPSFNLLSCFVDRPSGEKNRLSLGRKQCEEILDRGLRKGYLKRFGRYEAGLFSGTSGIYKQGLLQHPSAGGGAGEST